jgi:hypothetical protein
VPDEPGKDDATSPDAPTPDDATSTGTTADRRDAGRGDQDAATLRDAGRAALEREREARREADRRAVDAERRLQEIEDAGKSEIERAIARLDRQSAELDAARSRTSELETQLAARELLETKREIASELGVPIEAAHRLQGHDARSIRADAQRYLEERKPTVGDLGGGRGGSATGRGSTDMNALIREASGHQ